jgi:hypothetical protein
MSYREEGGSVTITMRKVRTLADLTDEECRSLAWAMERINRGDKLKDVVAEIRLNRLNQGNPNYTPYQIEKKK